MGLAESLLAAARGHYGLPGPRHGVPRMLPPIERCDFKLTMITMLQRSKSSVYAPSTALTRKVSTLDVARLYATVKPPC